MNVDRLIKLANVVEPGVAEFPELGLIMGFTMETSLSRNMPVDLPSSRFDIERYIERSGPRINSCGCLMGFTILLFSPLKYTFLDLNRSDFSVYNEAKLELDLDSIQAQVLFFGTLSRYKTGFDAARVIRKLVLTEQVDWSISEN